MIGYDPSIADVLRTTVQDAQDLVRSEIALAKAELREEVRRVGTGAAQLTVAAVSGLIAVVFLLTAAAWAIPALAGWPVWTGFAIVGGVVALMALVLALMGRSRLRSTEHMPLTMHTMKENMQWMKAHRA